MAEKETDKALESKREEGAEQKRQPATESKAAGSGGGKTKQERAKELVEDFQKNREEKKNLEKQRREGKIDAKGENRLTELNKELKEVREEAEKIISPEQKEEIREITDKKEINFPEALEKAKELQTEPEPEKNLAGVLLEDRVERLEEVHQRQMEVKKQVEAKREIKVEGDESFFETGKKLAEMQNQDPEEIDKAEQLRLIAIQEKRAQEAIDSNPELKREVEKLNELEEKVSGAKIPVYERLEAVAEVEKHLAEAREQEEREKAIGNPNTGVRSHILETRHKRLVDAVRTNTPEFRQWEAGYKSDEEKLGEIGQKIARGELSQEEGQRQAREIFSRRKSKEGEMVEGMPGVAGRAGYYELPDTSSVENAEKWVWNKIKDIDSAGISPSALVYSPSYGSLLNALPILGRDSKLEYLVDQINTWRTVYEFGLIFDASGSPGDVLAQSANIDPDAFLGLIGQRNNERGYTHQAEMVQKAFCALEENGHRIVDLKADERKALHKQISTDLNDPYGMVYERIAYRYWKFLGREAKFDYVRIKDEDGFEYPVSERGDKIATDRYVGTDSATGNFVSRRYDGYSKSPVKFWLRRIYRNGITRDKDGKMFGDFREKGLDEKRVGMLRQEKNINWVPTMFDNLGDYNVTDYITGKMLSGEDKKKAENGVITPEMLKNVDWANKGSQYGVMADAWNKAAKTREAYIAPDGILDNLSVDSKRIFDLKKFNETWDDKKDTGNVGIVRAVLETHKKQGFLPKIQIGETRNPDRSKSTIPNIRLVESAAQETAGVQHPAFSRKEMEDFIDEAISAGFISAIKGEELKREFLSFIGLLGIGPIRFGARVIEAAPKGILGVFFAMFAKFLELALPKEAGLSQR